MGSTAHGGTQDMVKYDYHQYEVIGRHVPTERDPQPKAYRIKLFTKNETQARSRFWYFIRRLVKMKKANAEILSVREIFEKKPEKVSKYGMWLRCTRRWLVVTVLVTARFTLSRCKSSRLLSACVLLSSSTSRLTLHSLCLTASCVQPRRASTRAPRHPALTL